MNGKNDPHMRGKKKIKTDDGSAILKVMIGVLVILIISVGALGFISYTKAQEMKAQQAIKNVVEVDKIYDNIYINGLHMGGLTKEEAIKVLNEKFQQPLLDKKITFVNKEMVYPYTYLDFNASYALEAAVTVAFDYARTGDLKQRYDAIMEIANKPMEIFAEYSYDENILKEKISELESKIYIAPIDATISRKDKIFTTTPERVGKKLNTEGTLEQAKVLLNTQNEGEVELILEEIQPKYFEKDFEKAKSLIGTYRTSFVPGDTGRNNNIRNAVSKINDKVVYPGETFSTNQAFNPITKSNGYMNAPIISGGKFVDDIGGGVCQVSSTLYDALLLAELQIVERQNHSLKVAYADYGFDATLAGDVIDLKFKNSMEYPIFIECYIDKGKEVVVNLYGYEDRNPTRVIKLENQLVETIPAPATQVTNDPNLPLGEKVVDTAARNGYRYNLIKIVYENNKEIERVVVNKSYYKPVKGEIRIGTKPTEAESTTNPTPIPQQENENANVSSPVPTQENENNIPNTTNTDKPTTTNEPVVETPKIELPVMP